MDKLFAVGDIHGELEILQKLLTLWNPDNEKLIFTGDYCDRGPDSFGVYKYIFDLKEKYGATLLLGNHDDWFLSWLKNPEVTWFQRWISDESIYNTSEECQGSNTIHYYANGGDKTINSFYGENIAYKYSPKKVADEILSTHEDLIYMIETMPDYIEIGDYVFVHAGVDLYLADWKNTSSFDMKWIREPFLHGKNATNKTFVFGHTPTRYLNKDGSDDVWFSEDKSKIGIDGGAVFGGALHGLLIDDGNYYKRTIKRGS